MPTLLSIYYKWTLSVRISPERDQASPIFSQGCRLGQGLSIATKQDLLPIAVFVFWAKILVRTLLYISRYLVETEGAPYTY